MFNDNAKTGIFKGKRPVFPAGRPRRHCPKDPYVLLSQWRAKHANRLDGHGAVAVGYDLDGVLPVCEPLGNGNGAALCGIVDVHEVRLDLPL